MADEVLLTELDNYLKAGIHIGTKFRTRYMERFIY
ncbi:30S ribosomal protein S2, partial [archaeon]|nr:30S ribosomal protein S2 [archaeon]